MRYVLNETKNDKVALEKEINFIKDYITLQRVRLTNKVNIEFNVEGDVEGARIAHLLLIPFVENAFKYGVSTKEPSDIIIRITIDDKLIHFYIANSIVAVQTNINGSTGIGLKNTQRRLELMYPDHSLKLLNENKKFIVDLTLNK
jgi:LytS/YehU family sensor histidine kinase